MTRRANLPPLAKAATLGVVAVVVLVTYVSGFGDERAERASRADNASRPVTSETVAPVADEAEVREWLDLNFSEASWYADIRHVSVGSSWVEVQTDLFPKEENHQTAVTICAATAQAPHPGEGFLTVRVLASDGRRIAANLDGSLPCEAGS